jgi:hypothetical protein
VSVLVAKAVAEELRDGEVSLFSTEAAASPASFSQEELFALSPRYSALYAEIIEALAPLIEADGLTPRAARTVLRDAAPTVAHFAIDRALRLARFVEARGTSGLFVAAPGAPKWDYPRPEALRIAAANSRELNEAVLARLAPVFGLASVASVPSPETHAPAVQPGFLNYNFEGRGPWSKALGRLRRAAARVWPGRAPALGLSYATFVLQDAGLFGCGGLEFVRGRGSFPAALPAPARRAALLAALADRRVAIEALLKSAPLTDACLALMADLFPADALEGARAHYAEASRVLAPFAPTALVLSETSNVEATYLLAAAHARGFETIGVQEGGHYGYEDDYVNGVELEYPHFDRYVTWGWSRFPDGAGMGRVTAVPLPAPWLSERRGQWRRDADPGPSWWEKERPYDLLLMSNKIYPYPTAPSGGAVSRSDHTPAFAAELVDLAARARAANVRILHKSFNTATMRQLAGTLAAMREAGGGCYAHVERLDKGMHPVLVARARMVLWDQPGTGFLECLTAGLPTMILWSRRYNREVPWARERFTALERAGLVHRDAASTLTEFARYKAAPSAWMRDAGRLEAARAFCAEYALADDAWKAPWRCLIREACSRR